MKLDWLAKLQHFLQTVAFCLAIAAVQVGFRPATAWAPTVAFSLCIGLTTWLVVDIGRHLLPSARETGWPPGLRGFALVIAGITAGFVLGVPMGDGLSRSLGLYPAGVRVTVDYRSAFLITLLAGLAGTYYFYSRSRSSYLERKVGVALRLADEARLKLLETQLEPHMLFNTLANLRVLIGVDPTRAQLMLDHMIAYLRATLDASRTPVHPLQQEFDRLRDYLALMAIRMGPRLAYELQLPDTLAQVPVPTLLLQPLVENAIKHGLEPQVAGGRLTVSAREDHGALRIEVRDTGAGPGDSATAGSGFGLEQVRERIRTVYGPRASLQLQAASPTGTDVILTLPWEHA